jgi:hypothetical protein
MTMTTMKKMGTVAPTKNAVKTDARKRFINYSKTDLAVGF